jgi:hypothetical protein
MMIMIDNQVKEFDFKGQITFGLFVSAGGFEDRSIAFAKRLRKSRCFIEDSLLLHYMSQQQVNEENYQNLRYRLNEIIGKEPQTVTVHADMPIQSSGEIRKKIEEIAPRIVKHTAIIDISGMTHMWAINTIHACLSCGFRTTVVYTEAKWYFPSKRDQQKVIQVWREHQYEIAAKYLQSAGLKAVHILPEFGGNFRPDKQTCLLVFVGYEPNRIEGLVDDYAPGRLIVLYGKSPHEELYWRTQLSKELHKELFSEWYIRETEISTLVVNEILEKLEDEFKVLQEQFDVAISPHCSKMQGLASYLFWRRHPEVQLLFTSPVKFNPDSYSRGAHRTFVYEIG